MVCVVCCSGAGESGCIRAPSPLGVQGAIQVGPEAGDRAAITGVTTA
jgi:hypothetical protein